MHFPKNNSMKPLILINFKTYPEASGEQAVYLAKKIALVKSKRYELAVAPPELELEHVCKSVKIPVFAQHVDAEQSGAHTGQITAAEVKRLGAQGTLLNHSERKLPFPAIKKTIRRCKHEKLTVIVCASTLAEVRKVVGLQPEYIAYEPKELIGGKVSVTSAKPEIIQKAVRMVKKISPTTKVLCGAGVHSRADLRKALELGAVGVLLSQAVVKAKDPKKMLEMMVG